MLSSLGLCRLPLSLAFDLEKSPDMVGGMRTARASRAHPTSSRHWSRIGMGLLCAQDALATTGILRKVNARPDARTQLLSTGRPLPAYSRRLVSLRAARSLCDAYGTRPAGSSRHASKKAAAAGPCARHDSNRCDLIEFNSPRMASACSLPQCSGCILHVR